MADVIATLLLGIGVGVFIGLFLSNGRLRKSHLLKNYFSYFTQKEESSGLKKAKSSDDEEDDEVG